MDFHEKTHAGYYDNDGGGRRPAERERLRARERELYLLTRTVQSNGSSRKVLVEQDWQSMIELCYALLAVAIPNLRISKQQSNSRDKRGEIEGNDRE